MTTGQTLLTLAWQQAERSAISWTIGFAMGTLVVGNIRKAIREHSKKQDEILHQTSMLRAELKQPRPVPNHTHYVDPGRNVPPSRRP